MRFRKPKYEMLVCPVCATEHDARRFKEGDDCRDTKCKGKLLGEDSTIIQNCPICVLKLSGDCKGDLEGCRAFKVRG